jgi:hypothetical protein
MWNDPLWHLLAARDELDAARRHLGAAGAVRWSGAVAGPFRSEVDRLLVQVLRLGAGSADLAAQLGCRP